MLRFLLGLFLILPLFSFGQIIRITNRSTGKPVKAVFIFNKTQTQTTETDYLGQASLKIFSGKDSLILQHPAYFNKTIFFKPKSRILKVTLDPQFVMIGEVVSSATRRETSMAEVPNTVVSISVDEIAAANPQTSADLLEQSGEVFVQKSQQGGGSPMIRGFASNSVLLAIDGVRLNNTIFRGGNLQNVLFVDPNNIASAEVVLGPGSVIYGSDALGGVMSFKTFTPQFSPNDSALVKSSTLARFSTANQEQTAHIRVDLGRQKTAASISLSWSEYGDLKAGSVRKEGYEDFGKRSQYIRPNDTGFDEIVENENPDIQRYSGYNSPFLSAKIVRKISEDETLTGAYHFSQGLNIPRYDRLVIRRGNDTLRYAEWYYNQRWQMASVNYENKRPTTFYEALSVTAAYQNALEERVDRDFQEIERRTRSEKLNILSLNVDADIDLIKDTHTLYYGVEGVFNGVNSTGVKLNLQTDEETETSSRYPDGGTDYFSAAAYGVWKWRVNPRNVIQAGARTSFFSLKSEFTDRQFFDFPYDEINLTTGNVSGNASWIYTPTNTVQINAVVSSGFRAPNLDDIGKVFDSEPGNVVVPNPNLKPENAYNAEIGFAKTFGESLKIDGAIFYTFLTNAMVRRDFTFNGEDSMLYDGRLSKVEALVNAGDAQIYGASFGLNYEIMAGLRFKQNYTITEGEDLENGQALRHVAPTFGKSSLTFDKGRFSIIGWSRYSGKIAFNDLAPTEQDKPELYTKDGALAWYTLNVSASLRVSEPMSLSFAVENILDHHYRTYSSGISAPGRNLIISLRGNF
jgi:hemoglobin/transferrin/lactoferrin receptor protein